MKHDLSRQTLGDLLRRTRQRSPNKLAIRCGEVDWTYAEFDNVCDRLASGLAARGVEIGDRVAVISRNSHAFVALRFALARLGAVLVPINFMLSANEANYILQHSGAKVLCVDSGFAKLGGEASKGTDIGQMVWLPGEDETDPIPGLTTFQELLHVGVPPDRVIAGSNLAQIIYTSGTESRPKGAMLTHDALISEYVTCLVDAEIAASDVVLHALPLYHCAQLDVFLGPCVYVGATSVITSKPTPENLLAMMAGMPSTLSLRPLRYGSVCCAPRNSTRLIYRRCARAITALRSCQWRCSRRCSGGCRECDSGTFTARPKSRRWPLC